MSFFKSAEDYYKEMTSTFSDVDISKHSLIYNALMPACYELSYQSMMLDEAAKRVFAKTALANGYYDDLINKCMEMGIERKLATIATGTIKVTGTKNSKLPNGSLVSTSLGLTYVTQSDLIINDLGIGYVNVIASAKGSKYNADIGEINSLPVKYEGIFQITNEEKFNNGYDDETYEALYERYKLKVQTPSTSGNKYHYEQWALEIDGCGSAKCVPAPGNVKVIITDSNKRAANKELIQEVYEHIDNVRPILAGTLTITTVKEVEMNITVNIEIDTTVILNDVQSTFVNLIKGYFNDAVYNTKKISIAKLGGLLISINGVVDHSNIKINDSISNISLTDEEIAVLGTVNLGVM